MTLYLDYSANRQQKQSIQNSKTTGKDTKETSCIWSMAQSFCRALLTTTANICKVIEETFHLYFKYIYLELFSKKKSHQ